MCTIYRVARTLYSSSSSSIRLLPVSIALRMGRDRPAPPPPVNETMVCGLLGGSGCGLSLTKALPRLGGSGCGFRLTGATRRLLLPLLTLVRCTAGTINVAGVEGADGRRPNPGVEEAPAPGLAGGATMVPSASVHFQHLMEESKSGGHATSTQLTPLRVCGRWPRSVMSVIWSMSATSLTGRGLLTCWNQPEPRRLRAASLTRIDSTLRGLCIAGPSSSSRLRCVARSRRSKMMAGVVLTPAGAAGGPTAGGRAGRGTVPGNGRGKPLP